MASITWVDWSIWLVYFVLITQLLWIYKKTKIGSHYQYFLIAFFVKTLGGIAFAFIYVYYYKFGDTFLYHRGGIVMTEVLLDSPLDYFRLLISDNGQLPPDLHEFSTSIAYSNTLEEWFMVKLLSPISLISFNSYLVLTLFMSTISFLGGWKLFLVFRDIKPTYEKFAFGAVFLFPSVIFWGGGIMKDTVTLFSFYYIIYVLYFNFFKAEFSIIRLIGMLISMYLIFKLKSYILIAFLPTIIFFFYYIYQSKIKTTFIRNILRPILFVGVIGIIFIALSNATELSKKYDVDRLAGSIEGFHSWHTTQGGSVYSLGEVELTPVGVASKIPAALNVTFFRPYFWEYSNPVILMGAAESFLVLILFLSMLWQSQMRPLRYLKNQHLLKSLIYFILIFGFAVGFTSYNYGALARYKMPLMSIFIFIVFYIYNEAKNQRKTDNSS